MQISNDIKILILEIEDYHKNEDYINSKRVGSMIGGIPSAALGGVAAYLKARDSGMSHAASGLAGLAGAGAGGLAGGLLGRAHGHYAGKAMANDPNDPTGASIRSIMKSNFKVNSTLAGLAAGGLAGVIAHRSGADVGDITKAAVGAGLGAGAYVGAAGLIPSIPIGIIHRGIVNKMRRNK